LFVRPHDLAPLLIRLQSPDDDLAIVSAHRNESSVVAEPRDLFRRSRMPMEDAVRDALVRPEAENVDFSFVVIDCVEVTSVRKDNLSAPADVMELRAGQHHVVWMNCVDFYSVKVSHHDVEARRVDCQSLDDVGQRFYCLQLQRPRMGVEGPDH